MSRKRTTKAPSFKDYRSSSDRATRALSGSTSEDTRCERVLRSTLWGMGLRFRKNVRSLPGRPDIVFPTERVAVFCDGDFWHGRRWLLREKRLRAGSNPSYWTAKIAASIERDNRQTLELQDKGWRVIRVWETDIHRDVGKIASSIAGVVKARRLPRP